MDTSLLVTKFQIPALRPDAVARENLLRMMDAGQLQQQRLILIAAPAGFGKTSVASAWLRAVSAPAAWITLDEHDNDPQIFFALLARAFQRIDPEIGKMTEQLLKLPQLPPIQTLCVTLLNEIAAANLNLVLVLDDYHTIAEESIHQALAFLIERQPPTMQTILLTREVPPLPLARLRARNQVLEIREADLRFTQEEAAQFFRGTLHLDLQAAPLQALHEQTEGWVAGMQLAGFAIQQSALPPSTFIDTFTGRHRYIRDYLFAEVLERLPPDEQEFLKRTSVLEQMNATLCDAVAEKEGSEQMLQRLEAANIFVIALDEERTWYRYHRLFADLLRSTLSADETKRLNLRACRWYEAAGYTRQALHYALAANAFDEAALLITACAETALDYGEIVTLAKWLDALPDALVRSNIDLAAYKGLTAILVGNTQVASIYADAAHELLESGHRPAAGGARLLLLQAYLALAHSDYDRVLALSNDILSLLGSGDVNGRLTALWLIAEAHERKGHMEATAATLHQAHTIVQGWSLFSVLIDSFLASAMHELGQRREALRLCEETLRGLEDAGNTTAPMTLIVLIRIAQLLVEGGELTRARATYGGLEPIVEQLASHPLSSFAYWVQARMLAAEGADAEALRILQAAAILTDEATLADTRWIDAEIVHLQVRMGDLDAVRAWAEDARWADAPDPSYLEMDSYLTYARCLIALGRLSDAQTWLARLEAAAERMGLRRRRLTIHILQAAAAERAGMHSRAREALGRAVLFAAPEDYVLAFLEEDDVILTLLAHLRPLSPTFVDAVLNAARARDLREGSTPALPLAEPLSEREIEVLRLIAEGLSNAEIAERLVIAESTVKRHINHIYGKLEVTHRMQAVLRARELGLA